jgi:nucleotide-binding universal stress UspA family protein
MLEHIIVPLDGSDRAAHALEPAIDLALRSGARLVLLRAAVPAGREGPTQEMMHQLVGQRPGLRYAVRTDGDLPAPAIAAVTGSLDGSLLCMSTRGRSSLGQALLGSVTEAVLRTVNRPVILVGPRCPPTPPAHWGPVLACVDGSRVSEQVLSLAADWARWLHTELVLVHAVDRDTGLPETYPSEEAYLRQVVERLPPGGPQVTTEVLQGGDPARALVRRAQQGRRGGLLALCTHGHRGFSRLVMGSVAMSIVRRARQPVLVQRARPSSP